MAYKDKIALKDAYGLLIPTNGFASEHIKEIREMTPKKGDIFLVTYPKCGTTWTQYIMWGVLHGGVVPPSFEDIMFKEIPFLEFTGIKATEFLPEPRTMKLHTPYSFTPISSEVKYICVARNPFDCCVSYFNHIKEMDIQFEAENMTFADFFDSFVDGYTAFGDYFDHLVGWYEHRNDPNVLFLFYENMKTDIRNAVQKIAEFLDHKLSSEALDGVIKYSSFDYMKQNLYVAVPTSMDDFSNYGPPKGPLKEINFFRKGQVGSWKEEMSEEQVRRLLKRIDERVEIPELKELITPASLRKTRS